MLANGSDVVVVEETPVRTFPSPEGPGCFDLFERFPARHGASAPARHGASAPVRQNSGAGATVSSGAAATRIRRSGATALRRCLSNKSKHHLQVPGARDPRATSRRSVDASRHHLQSLGLQQVNFKTPPPHAPVQKQPRGPGPQMSRPEVLARLKSLGTETARPAARETCLLP